MLRNLIRSALMDTASLLQWAIEFLTPDDPTPLGVIKPLTGDAWGEPTLREDQPDMCEDCAGDCGVCQAFARYYAPKGSGFDGGSAYHARADRD